MERTFVGELLFAMAIDAVAGWCHCLIIELVVCSWCCGRFEVFVGVKSFGRGTSLLMDVKVKAESMTKLT